MLQTTIQPYQQNDKEALLRILSLNTPQYFAPEEYQDFENYLEQETELYFVILHDSQIIGSGGINFQNNKSTGAMSWDLIHPDYQGKGIGTILLQHRLQLLKDMPYIQRITVRTSQLAEKFYAKNGFKLLEVQKDYWAKGFDLYQMEYIF